MSKRVFISLLLLSWCILIHAQRPKVGLVLSGGGAKGAAEVGVLKILERERIKIDYIAGTSIGAIIGGLYAAGYKAEEIEGLFLSQKLIPLLRSKSIKTELSFLLGSRNVSTFEDVKIPFRCVAVDRNEMEEYVLSQGDIVTAIQASMAVPEVFSAIPLYGKKLVDGAVRNNLPVDVVKSMGADVIIAIDLQQEESKYKDAEIKHKQNLKLADIYIHPDLRNYTASSISRTNRQMMIELGEREAKRHIDYIKQIINKQ